MRKMREAVIVATARTGLAKSFRGSFNQTRPDDMAAHCIKALTQKVPQLDPKEIDDVVMGTGFPEGPQGFNVGRNVAVMAGLPHDVPGSTVSRFCSSGLNAVAVAAHMVESEGADAVIGGGLESITMLQNDFNKNNLFNPWLLDHYKHIYMPMGLTAEVVAERYKVTREAQDEYALASQQRTAAVPEDRQAQGRDRPDDGQDAGDRQGDRRDLREGSHRRPRRVQPARDHPGEPAEARRRPSRRPAR